LQSVYLSGRFSKRAQLNQYRVELESLGIEVTSRWLMHDPPGAPRDLTDEQWSALALVDQEDVRRADGLVFFSEQHEGGGGRHVELGMAVAWSKQIIVVGHREHIFHRLPQIRIVADWQEALVILKSFRSEMALDNAAS
jgi:hypothetical protein